MTRLGPDVEGAQKLTGPWSIAQNAGYARQMLALLRSLHSECKMVFVDVKPGESCEEGLARLGNARAVKYHSVRKCKDRCAVRTFDAICVLAFPGKAVYHF